jgi:N-acetylglucosaminyldiphosphoundecaprenol N-acetyl-beta-D-mannosaminyltransferase
MKSASHQPNVEFKAPKTLDILGIQITPMTSDKIIEVVSEHIASRRRCVMSSMNFHGLYVYKKDSSFRALNRRSLARIDGMSIVWLARLLGLPVHRTHRVAWLDLIRPLLGVAADRGWRMYYLGGSPDVVSDGIAEIRRTYSKIAIDGHHGYLAHDGGREVRDRIRAFAPDMLIVGMGMSVQEKWILENENALEVPVIATAGACIEYVAGAVKTPPRWLGPCGLEWLYRLTTDPKRFWRRYLIEPWTVLLFLGARLRKSRPAASMDRSFRRRATLKGWFGWRDQ